MDGFLETDEEFNRATSRNPLVNALPPEILAHIFAYLLEPITELFPFPLPSSFHDWTVVTRVCWYWRAAALSEPSLWRRIHINRVSDESALRYLPLSGNLSLDVFYTTDFDLADPHEYMETDEQFEDKALKSIAANIDRLRELHIFSSLTENYSPWKYFTKPATRLEALTIISSDEDDSGIPYVLPPIFNTGATCLRKLVLANISLWPHDTFCNLTHLALYDQLDEARLPLHTFLHTMNQSPHLETLILISAGLEDDFVFDTSNLVKPVPLPTLRYLELGDWSFEMVPLAFLKHLIVPSEVTFCLWDLGWEPDLRSLLFPHPDDLSLLQRCTKINITSFLDSEHPCEAETLLTGVKGSTIYYYTRNTNASPCFSTLRSLGQFTNVTELNYCPDPEWINVNDEGLLALLPTLKLLRVSGAIWWRLDKLCDILTQVSLAQTEPQQPSRFRIAPCLEQLHIHYANSHGPRAKDAEDLQPLLLLANARANNGVPLKKLVVEGFTSEALIELKMYFDWVIEESRGCPTMFWENSVPEIWEKTKLARPPPPDW